MTTPSTRLSPLGADGSYYDGNIYTYLAGANGAALMQIGSNQQFSLIVGMHAPAIQPTSTVWINPIGITDAANYTPITNAYAPGELVNLYGNFGVSTQVAPSLPFPTTLDGVQVFVNGQAAPVYLVSQNQISALIPYEIAGQLFCHVPGGGERIEVQPGNGVRRQHGARHLHAYAKRNRARPPSCTPTRPR